VRAVPEDRCDGGADLYDIPRLDNYPEVSSETWRSGKPPADADSENRIAVRTANREDPYVIDLGIHTQE